MAKYQTWVSTTGDMAPVLEMIYKTFPDVEPGNDAQAYRRALTDWYLSRQSDGKRVKLDSIKDDTEHIPDIQQEIAQIRQLIAPMLERLMSLEAARAVQCDCAAGFDEDGMEIMQDGHTAE